MIRVGLLIAVIAVGGCDGGRVVQAPSEPRAGTSDGDGGTAPRHDGGSGARTDASPAPDTGPCTLPPAQPASAPCCTSLGVDACGANLFCAALDGRVIATCYVERVRQTGETCTGERQCASGSCSPINGKCTPARDEPCTESLGCYDPTASLLCIERRCREVACDPFAQTGCPAGETCAADDLSSSDPAWRCQPPGGLAEDARCQGPEQCGLGLSCTVIGKVTAQCLRPCAGEESCGAGRVCLRSVGVAGCVRRCGPGQTCPAPGESCVPISDDLAVCLVID